MGGGGRGAGGLGRGGGGLLKMMYSSSTMAMKVLICVAHSLHALAKSSLCGEGGRKG